MDEQSGFAEKNVINSKVGCSQKSEDVDHNDAVKTVLYFYVCYNILKNG